MRRIRITMNRFGSRCLILGLALLFALPTHVLPRSAHGAEVVDLGAWNREKIEALLAAAGDIPEPGRRIEFLSAAFLGTPYLANTLIGSAETPEAFVLRLDGVDCFTFVDTVEALRRSTDFDGFKAEFRRVRYRNGQVAFLQRNHFFSDWGAALPELRDVTAALGGEGVRRTEKTLNRKTDGSPYLPGIPNVRREIAYIPPGAVDAAMLGRLQSGDYLGIYTVEPGLDVSHVGIAVKKDGKLFLRHASSRATVRKVVDEELSAYLARKKGLVVYRAVER